MGGAFLLMHTHSRAYGPAGSRLTMGGGVMIVRAISPYIRHIVSDVLIILHINL